MTELAESLVALGALDVQPGAIGWLFVIAGVGYYVHALLTGE